MVWFKPKMNYYWHNFFEKENWRDRTFLRHSINSGRWFSNRLTSLLTQQDATRSLRPFIDVTIILPTSSHFRIVRVTRNSSIHNVSGYLTSFHFSSYFVNSRKRTCIYTLKFAHVTHIKTLKIRRFFNGKSLSESALNT